MQEKKNSSWESPTSEKQKQKFTRKKFSAVNSADKQCLLSMWDPAFIQFLVPTDGMTALKKKAKKSH